jgi:hypothetical protein
MTLSPLPDGGVEFSSLLRQEESRRPLGLLEPEMARDGRMIRICGWCHSVALPDGRWMPLEEAVEQLQLLEAETMPQMTHGICDSCLHIILALA